MSDKQLSLASRLALASLDLRGWQADKRNKEQNYDYISADAVLNRAGDALGKQGVVVIPSIIDHGYDIFTTPNGKNRYDAWVSFDMTMVCDGGEVLTCKWFGRGSDYTVVDKAAYKAITSGHKYFLMKLLNIGVGNEDSEHDEPEEKPSKKAQQAQSAPAQNKQAQAAPLSQTVTVGLILADLESDGIADSGKALAIIRAKWEPLVKAQFGAEKLVKRETAQAMYDHVKGVVSQQAPTPPPAPEQGTAGDVDGVAPLLDGVHYQALLAKTDPNIGDVIAALNGDNVTTPPIARGIIEQLYAEIKPTPAKKLKPETAATMYEAVVTNLPLL